MRYLQRNFDASVSVEILYIVFRTRTLTCSPREGSLAISPGGRFFNGTCRGGNIGHVLVLYSLNPLPIRHSFLAVHAPFARFLFAHPKGRGEGILYTRYEQIIESNGHMYEIISVYRRQQTKATIKATKKRSPPATAKAMIIHLVMSSSVSGFCVVGTTFGT